MAPARPAVTTIRAIGGIMAPVLTRRLPVAEGVSLHAMVWDGPRSAATRPPFLLVHGLSSNCQTWTGVGDRLHDLGHRVAAIDLRGHGRSDKPDHGYDFPTLVSDLQAALAALGFEAPIVAGQSTGGNLAVELGARAPRRVAGVVGVDGGVLDLQRQWPRWEDCEPALAPPRLEGTTREAFEAMIRRGHPDWDDDGVAATMANCEVLDDQTVRPWLRRDRHLRILRALWEQQPLDLLPALQSPLLLILADSGDGWTAGKRAAAHSAVAVGRDSGRDVRVTWLTGDHDLHVQHPGRVSELLAEFAGA